MKKLTIQFAGYGLQDETCIHGFETSAELLRAIAKCGETYTDALADVSLFDYGTGTLWKVIDGTEKDKRIAELEAKLEEVRGQYAYECECNKQLVECQKENAELKEQLENWQQLAANQNAGFTVGMMKQILQSNTKQVCEKIKRHCEEKIIPTGDGLGYCEEEYNRDTGFNEALSQIMKFLDQIERGEK